MEFERDIYRRKIRNRIIGAIILLSLVVVIHYFFKPQVTGYVVAPFNIVNLNVPVFESTSLEIGPQYEGQPLEIHNFRVSGKIAGEGQVTVTLNDGKQSYVVYDRTHEQKNTKAPLIGMVVKEPDAEGIMIDRSAMKISEDGKTIDGLYLNNRNDESHALLESMRFTWGSQNQHVTKIRLGSRDIFYDAKGTAGASHGEEIKGSSQTIRKREGVPLVITFSEPIGTDVVTVELGYRWLSSTFLLGELVKTSVELQQTQDEVMITHTQSESLVLHDDSSELDTSHTIISNVYLYNPSSSDRITIGGIILGYPGGGQLGLSSNSMVELNIDGKQYLTTPVEFGLEADLSSIVLEPKATLKIDSIKLRDPALIDRFTLKFRFSDQSTKDFEFAVKVPDSVPSMGGTGEGNGEITTPGAGETPDAAAPKLTKQAAESIALQQTATSGEPGVSGSAVYVVPADEEPSVFKQQLETNRGRFEDSYARSIEENTATTIRAYCQDTCGFAAPLSSDTYTISIDVEEGAALLVENIIYY